MEEKEYEIQLDNLYILASSEDEAREKAIKAINEGDITIDYISLI